MATLGLFVLVAACFCANALHNPPVTRNTIFLDEKLEGQIFENIDDYDKISKNAVQLNYRLPTTTRPVHYNVLWGIDITRFILNGTVEIQLVANQANVNEIVIHSHDQTLSSIQLRLGTTVIPQTHVVDAELHFLRVRLTSGTLNYNAQTPVVYTLFIEFNSDLRNDMYGIYRSWFRNTPTQTQVSWMASTQFQATSARFAFPCYDEPSFKATFDIVIRRPTNYKSWSCTRIRETRTVVSNYEDDFYNTTPVMSTYLLALVVAQYESIATQNTPLTYELIARQSAIAAGQGDYALEVGQRLTTSMNTHTGIEFFSMHPNLKMTHAAIPDFSAGAMENWGLITYREAYLMYDQNNTNDYFKQLIAYILSHEIAHMWFGNLVTCEFWDSLWLNEGFARYYQYFLTHWVEGYMGLDTRFINEQMHTALLFDSSESAHPLTNPNIGSPASVRSMFSTISYNKGAAVIRMTEHLLGTPVHTDGLRRYLNERRFGIARPIDLFRALETAGVAAGALSQYGNFSLVEYYRSWTEQSGHPILNVQVNHQTGDMIITQRRFSINTGYAATNLNYIIPITFATASNPNFADVKPSHILSNAVTVINRGSTGDQWVIFNKQQTGFYRVNYDPYTWDLIIVALRGTNRTLIHEYNRAQIVDDVFQFARAGLMSYTRAFNILSFLENETEYAPWVAALTGFNWLRNRLAGTTYLTRLEAQITRWATNVMTQLGYTPIAGETFMRSYLRYQLAPLMCNLNVAACRTAANNQFRALVVNTTPVPVNSRNWVYCNGLRGGTVADFDFLLQRYNTHNTYTEKILILQTLGCTPHAVSLRRFLSEIITENFVIRPQDYSVAFNSALNGNEGNTAIVLEFIQNNLQAVLNAFGSASPITSVLSRLRTVAEINQFQTWATQNQVALGEYYQGIVESTNSARQSLLWVGTVQDDLDDYFVNGDNVVTPSTVTSPPVTTPVTLAPPQLVEPESPNLPDSAITSVLSITALLLAFVVNVIV
ncbi:membrane alanyl aminopeptidase-like [Nymphalis io]|uniref:membrane alanyl aminopeptidase-like n=1 Tax=Inachis io TaxID=171585 RepID=UPI0021672424|nr:membrane alanyl aminopeptidase-like [Nymphalis io]